MASNTGNSQDYPYRNNNNDDQSDYGTTLAIVFAVVFLVLFIKLVHCIISQSAAGAPVNGGTAPSDRLRADAGLRRLEGGGARGVPVGLPRRREGGGAPMVCQPPWCTFTYRKDDGWQEAACTVCLAEFADGEAVRLLPVCMHYFHAACIDEWLRTRATATCPLCRAAPAAAEATV
ncbi:RING-H2 finger protein ATL66-like [Oryza brachyantha]|uniref:RING-type E3 ubiquitin transferase n=1 Tax=Oryza brachyantha TaxID=4533 RepID=J3NAF3_ORYBR|nr:RING-H2 finger protein ATL66-like [Oryza brachyantha]